MSLASCLRSARRNWYLLVICALVAAGSTLYLTLRETPQYRSSLRLAVGPSPTITRETRIAQAVDSLNKRALITTLAEMAGAQRIYSGAAAGLGLSGVAASHYSVSAVALPEANVISLAVQGPYRTTAAALAAAISAKATTSIEGFYKDLSIRQLDEPTTPTDPVTPKPKRDVPLAAVFGLCLGFFVGLTRDRVRGRAREPQPEAP